MFRSLSAVAVVLALASPGFASGTPMDEARWQAWGASHIVVADSTGKVLEVWKGDLKVGDALPVDQKEWKLRLPQVVRHGGVRGNEIEGQKVHADRVILFLWKTGKNSPDNKKEGEWQGLRPYFVSAGKGGVFAQVYAPEGDVQPVYAVAKTEADFKAEYMPIAERRTFLDAALAEPDVKKRAERLGKIATELNLGQREAIEALAKCGEAGIAPLAAVLLPRDVAASRASWESMKLSAIESLRKIGKPAAGELVTFIELQRTYWMLVAPDLRSGWYDGRSDTAGTQLRLLFGVLADPELFADVPAEKRAAFRDLYELWTKTPHLADVKTSGDLHPARLLKPILDGWDKK